MTKMVLSGPITGVKDFQQKFGAAGALMREDGFENVFSPAELEWSRPGHSERWYMARCLEAQEDATHIYMMSGWEHSAGCRAEWSNAVKIGLKIVYENR